MLEFTSTTASRVRLEPRDVKAGRCTLCEPLTRRYSSGWKDLLTACAGMAPIRLGHGSCMKKLLTLSLALVVFWPRISPAAQTAQASLSCYPLRFHQAEDSFGSTLDLTTASSPPNGEVGRTNQVQVAQDLAAPNWQPTVTIRLTNDPQVVSLPLPADGPRFWRVLTE